MRSRSKKRRRTMRARQARFKPKTRQGRKRVGDKIRTLRHESVPRDQAIAMSLSMERAGRLRPGGKYVRARKKRKANRK